MGSERPHMSFGWRRGFTRAKQIKLLLEQARKLRERSALLQAQSKDLQNIVREQHYEMLLLLQNPWDNIPVANDKSCKPDR